MSCRKLPHQSFVNLGVKGSSYYNIAVDQRVIENEQWVESIDTLTKPELATAAESKSKLCGSRYYGSIKEVNNRLNLTTGRQYRGRKSPRCVDKPIPLQKSIRKKPQLPVVKHMDERSTTGMWLSSTGISSLYDFVSDLRKMLENVRTAPLDDLPKAPKQSTTASFSKLVAYARKGTKDYVTSRSLRWKRFCVQRFVASYKNVALRIGGRYKRLNDLRCAVMVKQLFNNLLDQQQQLVTRLIHTSFKMAARWQKGERLLLQTNNESTSMSSCATSAKMACLYGGARIHVKSAETFGAFITGRHHDYYTMDEIDSQRATVSGAGTDVNCVMMTDAGAVDDNLPHRSNSDAAEKNVNTPDEGCGAENSENNENVVVNNIGSQLNNATRDKRSAKIWRLCDADCCVPDDWAREVHSAVGAVCVATDARDILQAVMDFEDCTVCFKCKNSDIFGGSFKHQCTNGMNTLREYAVHFQGLRTVQREYYNLRSVAIKLIAIDMVVRSGNYTALSRMLEHLNVNQAADPSKPHIVPTSMQRPPVDESIIEQQFGHLTRKFHEKLMDYPVIPCDSCHILFQNAALTTVGRRSRLSHIFRNFVTLIDRNYDEDNMRLCRDCIGDLRHGDVPKRSTENRLQLTEVPEQLQTLNLYETMLVQRAKCFQTTIRLKPYLRETSTGSRVLALKGTAAHLPLPKTTVQETCRQLPHPSMVNILVDSQPSNKKVIWRSIVSMDKIRRALVWLKENNRLYHDIIINENFLNFREDLPIQFVPIPGGAEATEEAVQCQREFNRLQSTDSLLEAVDTDDYPLQYTIQPLQVDQPNVDDTALFRMKKVDSVPIENRNEDLDISCFPKLFPDGNFGAYDPRRQIPLAKFLFYRTRLKHKDRRFSRDQQYIFSCQSLKDLEAINSGCHATMKVRPQGHGMGYWSARQVKLGIQRDDTFLNANLRTVLGAVKGTRQYWNQRKSDLIAMIEQYGPATFFVTLSCAEYSWEDMREFLWLRNNDIPNVRRRSTSSLCVQDPASVSEHFHRRFKLHLQHIIRAHGGPFGEVEHHFARVEYQARGAPHVHMLLWIKGAPVMGRDSDEEVKRFISKHITCELPSADTAIGKLVRRFQQHGHTGTCMRYSPVRGWYCRFGFDRAVTSEITLHSVQSALLSRQPDAKGPIRRIYSLQRNEQEVKINDYNPPLILSWKGNVDCQYVGENTCSLVTYLTSYVTKVETQETKELWQSIDKSKSQFGQLQSFGIKMLKQREMGSYEAADRLLGHPLCMMSETVRMLDNRFKEKRNRKLVSAAQLEREAERDGYNIFTANMTDTYYPDRPHIMEDVCLHDVYVNFDMVSIKRGERIRDEWLPHLLLSGGGYFRRRMKPYLVKSYSMKPTDENSEQYFFALLLMFKPFRQESELLGRWTTYRESFVDSRDILVTNAAQHPHNKKRLEAACAFLESTQPETSYDVGTQEGLDSDAGIDRVWYRTKRSVAERILTDSYVVASLKL